MTNTYNLDNLDKYIDHKPGRYKSTIQRDKIILTQFISFLNSTGNAREAYKKTIENLTPYGINELQINVATFIWREANGLKFLSSSKNKLKTTQEEVLNVGRALYKMPNLTWGDLLDKLNVNK